MHSAAAQELATAQAEASSALEELNAARQANDRLSRSLLAAQVGFRVGGGGGGEEHGFF